MMDIDSVIGLAPVIPVLVIADGDAAKHGSAKPQGRRLQDGAVG